jgi:Amidohydrolase ring-opening protein (Amido_AtzD_TrzD)
MQSFKGVCPSWTAINGKRGNDAPRPSPAPGDCGPTRHCTTRCCHQGGRGRSRDHRRHCRQDRGQWLRQRFHPRLRHPGPEAVACREPQMHALGNRPARRHRHVRRHRRRAVTASPSLLPRASIGGGLRQAPRHRHRPHPRVRPGRDRSQPQIRATAEAVAAAMEDAGITSPADVHFVQIKRPLLTKERIEEAARRGASVATDDTYHSMALSRSLSPSASLWRWARWRPRPRLRSAATGRSIRASPAPRPASSFYATRSWSWATPPVGPATW